MRQKHAKRGSHVAEARSFAKKAHEGQFRTSGEPYFTHLAAVAELLHKDLDADEETIVAALLHDAVEDTDVTYETVRKKFGTTIAKLVEGVTKVRQMESTLDKKEQNLQSIRKIFRTMGKDIRVIFIKLADRLHNMQTLDFVPVEKQMRIARETRDIYRPLADLLGIRSWYQQLSDTCFRILEPASYDLIRRKANSAIADQYSQLQKWCVQLEERFHAEGWKDLRVSIAPRHFHGIHEETKGQETLLKHIEMFHRIHIVIPDKGDCYSCLGDMHRHATPIPGSVDDYVAMPKINGYQALHTTVLTSSGNPIDAIIQTRSMEKRARLGVAILYKHPDSRESFDLPPWIETLTSLEKNEKDLHTFFTMIQSEIFGERKRVFILGEKKKSIDIPERSSVLDAAFYANDKTGRFAEKAFVNGEETNLKRIISGGDTIQIIGDGKRSPRRTEDLLFLRTSFGKKKFMALLASLPRQELVRRGTELMQRTIDVAMDPFFGIGWQKLIRQRVERDEDVLENIGKGNVNPFTFLEENGNPEDFFLIDPDCFRGDSRLLPVRGMRYVLRADMNELRRGDIIGLQVGPDIIDVISAGVLKNERRFSKEYIPLKIDKERIGSPLHFALRFNFDPEANPLEAMSALQNILDSRVKLLRFDHNSVCLGFYTDTLRTVQIAYEYLYGLPYISRILRISP